MPTVIACGSRHWTDHALVEYELRKLERGTLVLHGACRGADTIAASIAKALGLPVRAYPANWTAYGNRAGPIRNQIMLTALLESPGPHLVIAFGGAAGTADMVRRAEATGVPVRRVGRGVWT